MGVSNDNDVLLQASKVYSAYLFSSNCRWMYLLLFYFLLHAEYTEEYWAVDSDVVMNGAVVLWIDLRVSLQ
mgnify:CR=1 FL=1